LRKELLWPYVQEFVDGSLAHILNMSRVLGEQIGSGGLIWPHVIHGHYADAGDIASLLSGALNVPMVLTGHSLGRNKLEQLLKQGRQSKQDINATYKIMRRIEAEELSLDAAELVITSTKQEIEEQWGLYDGFDVKLERVDCHGRYMPRMVVIPPGMDFSNVIVQEATDAADGEAQAVVITSGDASNAVPVSPRAKPPIWEEVLAFSFLLLFDMLPISHTTSSINHVCCLYPDHAFLHQPPQAHDSGAGASGSEEEPHHPAESVR
jgi:sucrose-phosphate synthase